MGIDSYLKRSSSIAEMAASLAVYAGSELLRLATAGAERAAAAVGGFFERATRRGEVYVEAKARKRRA